MFATFKLVCLPRYDDGRSNFGAYTQCRSKADIIPEQVLKLNTEIVVKAPHIPIFHVRHAM